MTLESLGWHDFFKAFFAPYGEKGLSAGRVAVQHRDRYVLYGDQGEIWAHVTGKFRHDATVSDAYPAVGDWVAFQPPLNNDEGRIHAVLERRSKISRKVAGAKTEEQVLAANVDVVFFVMGLDGNFNIRRLERALSASWESGARPVVVLNKADLCVTLQEHVQTVEQAAPGVAVVTMSASRKEGLDTFLGHLPAGTTGVLIGSSGVGKSTITNALLGTDRQAVAEVRSADSRGRHTTSRRELLLLPSGGMIIDSPGIRELQFWGSGEGISEQFEDIESIARQCRFNDCTHQQEPACAIKEALENGTIEPERWKSYLKLQRELHYLYLKQNDKAARLEKEKWKKLMKIAKQSLKRKYEP